MTGWIKLHRKLTNSAMYQSLTAQQRDVLIQMLLMANHEPREWKWGKTVFICQPGQFITSREKLKKRCAKATNIRTIRTTITLLEKHGFLTNKTTKAGRLITICKWATYQNTDKQNDQHFDQPNPKKVVKTTNISTNILSPNKKYKEDKEEDYGNSENFSEKKINEEPIPPECNPRFKSLPIDRERQIRWRDGSWTEEEEIKYQALLKVRGL